MYGYSFSIFTALIPTRNIINSDNSLKYFLRISEILETDHRNIRSIKIVEIIYLRNREIFF